MRSEAIPEILSEIRQFRFADEGGRCLVADVHAKLEEWTDRVEIAWAKDGALAKNDFNKMVALSSVLTYADRTRRAQREYFRTRSQDALRDAKKLEKFLDEEIDKAYAIIDGVPTQGELL